MRPIHWSQYEASCSELHGHEGREVSHIRRPHQRSNTGKAEDIYEGAAKEPNYSRGLGSECHWSFNQTAKDSNFVV